jgi:hypothetical protein
MRLPASGETLIWVVRDGGGDSLCDAVQETLFYGEGGDLGA